MQKMGIKGDDYFYYTFPREVFNGKVFRNALISYRVFLENDTTYITFFKHIFTTHKITNK